MSRESELRESELRAVSGERAEIAERERAMSRVIAERERSVRGERENEPR